MGARSDLGNIARHFASASSQFLVKHSFASLIVTIDFLLWLFRKFSQESLVKEVRSLYVLSLINHHSSHDLEECLRLVSELSHHLTSALLAQSTIHARFFLSDQISQPNFFYLAFSFLVEDHLIFKKIDPRVIDVLAQLLVRVNFQGLNLCLLRTFNL